MTNPGHGTNEIDELSYRCYFNTEAFRTSVPETSY